MQYCFGPTQGVEMGARIALLKFQTTRMNHLVADNAVQVFGGRGVTQTGMGRVVEVPVQSKCAHTRKQGRACIATVPGYQASTTQHTGLS